MFFHQDYNFYQPWTVRDALHSSVPATLVASHVYVPTSAAPSEFTVMVQVLSAKVISYLSLLTILLPFWYQETEMGRDPETLHSNCVEDPKTL